MSSELISAYDEVARIGTAFGTAQSCWRDLMTYLSRQADIGGLSAVAIDEDVCSVGKQLKSLLENYPPDVPLTALYFGLYDGIDENGHEVAGFHVAGIEHFDPKNPESLCHPSWQPKGRYLKSASLDELKLAELAASGEAREFLSYAGQLGVALIVSRFAAGSLVPDAVRVVGFDSGDYVEFLSQGARAV